jgi:hypothetical protein
MHGWHAGTAQARMGGATARSGLSQGCLPLAACCQLALPPCAQRGAAATDGAAATKAAFEAALAERDAEIAELHEQVAFEKRR